VPCEHPRHLGGRRLGGSASGVWLLTATAVVLPLASCSGGVEVDEQTAVTSEPLMPAPSTGNCRNAVGAGVRQVLERWLAAEGLAGVTAAVSCPRSWWADASRASRRRPGAGAGVGDGGRQHHQGVHRRGRTRLPPPPIDTSRLAELVADRDDAAQKSIDDEVGILRRSEPTGRPSVARLVSVIRPPDSGLPDNTGHSGSARVEVDRGHAPTPASGCEPARREQDHPCRGMPKPANTGGLWLADGPVGPGVGRPLGPRVGERTAGW